MAALGLASPAAAQEESKITPPKLVHHEPAAHPAGAPRSATTLHVELVLELDAEGRVLSAKVAKGAGDAFDTAAREAALRTRFEPARRDGKPVPSLIRYRYEFAPLEPAAIPPGVIGGRVRVAGTPAALAGAEVRARGEDGRTHSTLTDATGAWRLGDLPPGRYRIEVRADGYVATVSSHEARSGTELELAHELAPPAAADEKLAVTVVGQRPVREVTRRTLERREIERIPGSRGDALRSIQSLPGMARAPGLAGLLIVRGSSPQDTQVFVEGAPLPLLYHVGALSSVIPTEMVERIDYYPGNFAVRFGRAMGGVIDVGLRDPDTTCLGPFMRPTGERGCYHGLAQVDLVDARVLVQGPVGPLRSWSFAAGARRSHVDAWLGSVQRQAGAGIIVTPIYYDFQLVAQTRPARDARLRIALLGSQDRVDVVDEEGASSRSLSSAEVSTSVSWVGGFVSYEDRLSPEVDVFGMVAAGRLERDFEAEPRFAVATSHPVAVRSELGWRVHPRARLALGMDFVAAPYEISSYLPPPRRFGEVNPGPNVNRPLVRREVSGNAARPGWYLEGEIHPHPRLKLIPGLRLDHATDADRPDLSPRFAARYELVRADPEREILRTTLKGGVGIFHQPPELVETDPVLGTPGLDSNRAVHYSLGVEQGLTRQIDASVEGFYKDLDQLVSREPAAGGRYRFGNLGTGSVVGLETLLRYHPDERFFGWIAYTLSRSLRRDGPDEPEGLFRHDQTHNLTALGSYRLGRGWEFGARFRLVTGRLYRTLGSHPSIYAADAGSYTPVESRTWDARLPTFHQLDLRIEKRWQFRVWRLTTYLDVLNAYNHQGVDGYAYDFDYTDRIERSGLPLVPSLGIRGEI